jgi:hypothetical protein
MEDPMNEILVAYAGGASEQQAAIASHSLFPFL